MKYLTLLVVLFITACSTTEPIVSGYLPHDPLQVKCVNGEKVVFNSRSELKTGEGCEK